MVTIVVLIILATVSIQAVFSEDGLIKQAIQTVENYKEKKEIEEIKLALNEWNLEEVSNPEKTFVSFMEEKFGTENVTANGETTVIVKMKSENQYRVTKDGTVTKVGEEANQLNEYGFYYGVPYIGEDADGKPAIVFYSNGTCEMFERLTEGALLNSSIEFDTCNPRVEYANKTIKITYTPGESDIEMIFSVSENGQEISCIKDDQGNTMTARCDFTQIPHGGYVGKTYEGEYNSQKISMVVNSDGLLNGKLGEQNLNLTWTFHDDWTLIDPENTTNNTENFVIFNLEGTKAWVLYYDIEVILELKEDEEIESSNNLIPEGGEYTIKSNGMVLTGDGATVYFPKTSEAGDKFVYGDYEYRYNDGKLMFLYANCGWATEYAAENEGVDISIVENLDGWGVDVLDKTKSEYADMLSTVNGKNVKYLAGVFSGCSNMKKTPKISTNAEIINTLFGDCTTLDDISEFEVPTGITNMSFVFYECSSLNDASVLTIPNNITNLSGTFGHCSSLTKLPDLSGCTASSILMDGTFEHCTSLTTLEGLTIPSGVKTMGSDFWSGCFQGCTNLTDASNITIPSGCTDISKIFQNCTSLTKGPTIPGTITSCYSSFENTSLLTEIQFNGTKEQWNNLNSSNSITGKTIRCTDGDIEL